MLACSRTTDEPLGSRAGFKTVSNPALTPTRTHKLLELILRQLKVNHEEVVRLLSLLRVPSLCLN